ncbi:MAG: hypothetical protein AAF409_02875 [Pseudomonadota bacterium]
MTEEDINRVVDAELARRRIGAAFEPKQGRLSAVLRHPLFLTVFAFVVTTVIGGFYDGIVQDRRAEALAAENARAQRAAEAELAVAGVEAIARLAFEINTRARFVAYAVWRGDLESAEERKDALDALSIRWDTEFRLNLMKIRGYLGNHLRGNHYESAFANVVAPSMETMMVCIAAAFDRSRTEGFARMDDAALDRPLLPWCASREFPDLGWFDYSMAHYERSGTCTNMILWALSQQIRENAAGPVTADQDVERLDYFGELAEGCKGL